MSITVPLYGFGGGGGTSLNFDVKAYATEEALLAATPKENTIGIITTTPITSWIFSAMEPSEPVGGIVWINTGTSSDVAFNALKKNEIHVYPLYAKQYVGGAWVDVTAMSYRNGTWETWLKGYYLFKSGEGKKVEFVSDCEANATVDITSQAIVLDTKAQINTFKCITTAEAIDVSEYTKLICKAKCTLSNSGRPGTMILSETQPTRTTTSGVASLKFDADSNTKEYSIDISSIPDGAYYIAIVGWVNAEIYDWYLTN